MSSDKKKAQLEALKRLQGESYAGAGDKLEALRRLQAIEAQGELRPSEANTLTDLQAAQPTLESVTGGTDARYRGAMRGATLGLADEGAGLLGMLGGKSFSDGKQAAIAKDQAANAAFPDEFNKGQLSGSIATALMGGVGAPVLKGTGMLGKMLMSGSVGGAFGAAQGYSDYEVDPSDGLLRSLPGPTAIGAMTGAAVYPVAKGVGGIARAMRRTPNELREFSAKPVRAMTKAIDDTRASGLDIQDYLSSLTDEAALADVPGPLQGRAQGLAAMRGEGGSALSRFVEDRAKSAGQRIEDQVTETLGKPNSAFLAKNKLASDRSNIISPDYEAALKVGDIGAERLVKVLDDAKAGRAGAVHAKITKLQSDIEKLSVDGKIPASALHDLRSDLSDAIFEAKGTKLGNGLKPALKLVDDHLDALVPGYADARMAYAENMGIDRAIDEGGKVLRGGRATAMSVDEFNDYFGALTTAEKEAFRTGLRRDVAALMGTSRNDAASAWGEFAKGWNEEKLRIALGDSAEDIIKRLRSEAQFSKTRGAVTQGSRTAETQESRESLGDFRDQESGRRPGPLVRVKRQVDDIGNSLIDSLLYGNKTAKANAQLGEMLSATGQRRDDLLNALLQYNLKRNAETLPLLLLDKSVKGAVAGAGGALTAQ